MDASEGATAAERAARAGVLLRLDEIPWLEVSDKVPGVLRRTLSEADDNAARLRISLARLQPGGYFPEHLHPYPQVFIIMAGRGRVLLDGEPIEVGPGDVVRLFHGEKHKVENPYDDADLVLYQVSVRQTQLRVNRG